MDSVARLTGRERGELFRETSAKDGRFNALIVEKDFWVCWILQKLFGISELQSALIFKGGTSLSKVYNAIERFSEDIDLSLSRELLGFTGENDPANPKMAAKRRKRILEKQLPETAQKYVCGFLKNKLENIIQETLDNKTDWAIEIAPEDKDQQTLLFKYPVSVQSTPELDYIKQFVRLELGARSEHWPKEIANISSYSAEQFPDVFKQKYCRVECLSVNRTFWEKVTLLHALYFKKSEKTLQERSSRHYYDVYKLLEQKQELNINTTNIKLLESVCKHKMVFYKSAWAHYETAVPGSLRLVPPELRHSELSQDYRLTVRDMIYGYAPTLKEIFNVLYNFESEFNK